MERHQGCGVRGHRGRAAEGSCVGWAGCSGRGQVRGVEVAVCWVPVSPGSAGGTRGTVDVLGKQGALGRTVSPPPKVHGIREPQNPALSRRGVFVAVTSGDEVPVGWDRPFIQCGLCHFRRRGRDTGGAT